ncbi:uncharacterized protein LOC134819988 [Bolinopsis microptera]|uniref:uncharacterized protein LOC134819988 n=1 Tax=Bolinopsis microptera TaxID=2820187 RepID=UPI00307A6D52
MSGVSCQLLQLDGISERRSEILSTQDQLSRYIGDISSLYSTLHNDSVRVSSEVSHGYLDIRLRELPQTSSNISRFVKVELKPSLPTLLHHIGDCHVMTLLPSNQEALVTVQLPSISELVTVSVTVTLIYKCPEVIGLCFLRTDICFSIKCTPEPCTPPQTIPILTTPPALYQHSSNSTSTLLDHVTLDHVTQTLNHVTCTPYQFTALRPLLVYRDMLNKQLVRGR